MSLKKLNRHCIVAAKILADYNNNSSASSEYFTIEALEDGLQAKLSVNACEYSLDGNTWNSLSAATNTPAVNIGDKIYFRGNLTPTSSNGIGTFTISKKCNVKGNIMSLLYGDDFVGQTDLTGKNYAFYQLFKNCTYIVDASELILPATTLADFCYSNMFEGCRNLTTAIELPVTTLANGCYSSMFKGCTSLTTAPELPATTLAINCYSTMFNGCSKLTTAPALPATTLASNCYSSMFNGCTSLTTAPELPATTLASYCYSSMFEGCRSLTTAPELPATTLANSCYSTMFNGCTVLTTAPALPATTLAGYCYREMFNGTVLTTAPELPATTLANDCYSGMFKGCTVLTTAPALPATTLASNCYSSMFNGCTGLTTAPALPATTLKYSCYESMFEGCTGLTTAPELPATTLASDCYSYMFYGCSSLTTAPELPATTLSDSCYYSMFYNCSRLTTAPELPATTLVRNCYNGMFSGTSVLPDCTNIDFSNSTVVQSVGLAGLFAGTKVTDSDLRRILPINPNTQNYWLPATTLTNECYRSMFYGCSSLTTAPELPATTLSSNCYRTMFYNCSKLNYIKALFTTTPGSSYTSNWVSGVSSTGTFVKHPDMNSLPTGNNGIPEGWTVVNDGESNVNLITFTINDTEYQAEEGMTWEEWVESEYNTSDYRITADGDVVTQDYDYVIGDRDHQEYIIPNNAYLLYPYIVQ